MLTVTLTAISNTSISNTFAARLALSLACLGAALALMPSAAKANVPTPLDSTYVLTFDDEFNAKAIDTKKWVLSAGTGNGGYDSGDWTPSNPKVGDGSLLLPVYDTAPGKPPYTGRYQFAGVRTALYQKYGYWEARVKMPASGNGTGDGIWPAFWLNAGDKLPEIDIMEWLGYQPTIDYMTLHYGDNVTLHATPPSIDSPSFPSGWHVLGMLWTPAAITWYVDGLQTAQVSDAAVMAQFNTPLSVILNNSIVNKTKSWGAPVDVTTVFPSNFYVDYVHIYSNDPGAKTVASQPGYGGPGDDSKPNLLTNGGFETGKNWADFFGDAKVTKSQPQNGQYAALITGGSSEQQTITGLKPNTSYTLSGSVKLATPGDGAVIGVKNYGGAEVNTPFFSTAYTQGTVTFTTGKTNTSALIYFYKSKGAGAYGDDFSVEEGNGT